MSNSLFLETLCFKIEPLWTCVLNEIGDILEASRNIDNHTRLVTVYIFFTHLFSTTRMRENKKHVCFFFCFLFVFLFKRYVEVPEDKTCDGSRVFRVSSSVSYERRRLLCCRGVPDYFFFFFFLAHANCARIRGRSARRWFLTSNFSVVVEYGKPRRARVEVHKRVAGGEGRHRPKGFI